MTLQAATDLLLTVLHLRPAMRILDVASGPGEPAISIACHRAMAGTSRWRHRHLPEYIVAVVLNHAIIFA